MKRRLFNAAAVVSLVLLLATVGLWVRSQWVGEHFTVWRSSGGTLTARSLKGEFEIVRGYAAVDARARSAGRHASQSAAGLAWRARHAWPGESGVRHDWEFMGFAFFQTDGGTPAPNFSGSSAAQSFSLSPSLSPPPAASSLDVGFFTPKIWYASMEAAVPYWALAAVFALLPFSAGWRVYAGWRHHSRRGLCARCGYDVRATPDRCPECGTAVTPRVEADGAAA